MKITLEEVKARLESLAIGENKVAYFSFTEKIAVPYIEYYSPHSQEDGGDTIKLFSSDEFIIDLYTKKKDRELEKRIEALFPEVELERTEILIPENKMILNKYRFEAVNDL